MVRASNNTSTISTEKDKVRQNKSSFDERNSNGIAYSHRKVNKIYTPLPPIIKNGKFNPAVKNNLSNLNESSVSRNLKTATSPVKSLRGNNNFKNRIGSPSNEIKDQYYINNRKRYKEPLIVTTS